MLLVINHDTEYKTHDYDNCPQLHHHHNHQDHNLSQININKFSSQVFLQLHRLDLDLVAAAPRHPVLISNSAQLSNIQFFTYFMKPSKSDIIPPV